MYPRIHLVLAYLILATPSYADWKSKRTKHKMGFWEYRNAMPELRAAADSGDAEAQVELADLIQNGKTYAPQDEVAAFRYYEKAAAAGNKRGMSSLSHAYQYGRGVPKDCARAYSILKDMLQLGHVSVAHLLRGLSSGQGTSDCPPQAPEKFEEYKKFSDIALGSDDVDENVYGDPKADYRLGWIYADGSGVIDKNDDIALKFFRRSAKDGYAPADWAIGYFHAEGRGGLSKDIKAARESYERAANKGHAVGAKYLAWTYASEGPDQDFTTAMKWFKKAADLGNKDAWASIGYMHAKGQGVKVDLEEAVRMYRKAAEMGSEEGQHNLGAAYRDGEGVTKDELEAYRWLRVAAKKCPGAKDDADKLAAGMVPDQLDKARKLAGETP